MSAECYVFTFVSSDLDASPCENGELTVRNLPILPTDSVAGAIAKSVASRPLKGNFSAAAETVNRAKGLPQQAPEVSRN
jgi:hypothetical protein